jgi:hypothetical protein
MVQPTLERAMTHITLAQLKKHGACTGQLLLFKQMFGDKVCVTEALAAELAQQFDFTWAAYELLSDVANVEYNKVRGFAWAEYVKVCDLAWAEYNKARDLTQAKYNKVHDPAWAEYVKVCDFAWAEYNKVRATTFARLYIAQE